MARFAHSLCLAAGASALACSMPGDAVVPARVDTPAFDGRYVVVPDRSFPAMRKLIDAETDPTRREARQRLLQMLDRFANFRIDHGVIRSGSGYTQEFSLQEGTVEGTTLRGRAVSHEDIHDPGDSSEVAIVLRLDGDELQLSIADESGPGDPIVLRRVH